MPRESLEPTPNPSEWALLCPRAVGPHGHRHSGTEPVELASGLREGEELGSGGLNWMLTWAWWLGAESEVSLTSALEAACCLCYCPDFLAGLTPNPRAVVSSPSSAVCQNCHLLLAMPRCSFGACCRGFLALGGVSGLGWGSSGGSLGLMGL